MFAEIIKTKIYGITFMSHAGHMVYMLLGNDGRPPCLFTGDHLFVGGCGESYGWSACMYICPCQPPVWPSTCAFVRMFCVN